MKIPPARTANPGSNADFNDIAGLQRSLMANANDLWEMAGDLAKARVVREYDSDRKKRILAIGMIALIKAGESAAKAEAEARASEPVKAGMDQLAKELTAAEEVIARHDAVKIAWESCRSLLSMSRETLKQL